MENIICIADNPELIPQAAKWFSEKWCAPSELYTDSMAASVRDVSVPRWYVCMADGCIIGGAGVIENDFHERKDLSPNVCAVYVEEAFRCRGIARRLLERICRDMHGMGIDVLYLITDHTSFYERYGWEYFCDTREDGGGSARVYVHKFGKDKAGIRI